MVEPGGPVGKSYPILQACSTKMTGGDLTVDSQDEFGAPPMVNELRAGGGAQASLNFRHFFTARAKVAGATDLISVKDMLAATAADALLAAVGGSDLIGDDPTLAEGSIAGSRVTRRCGGAARGAAAQRRPSRRGDHPRHRIIQHRLRAVQPAQAARSGPGRQPAPVRRATGSSTWQPPTGPDRASAARLPALDRSRYRGFVMFNTGKPLQRGRISGTRSRGRRSGLRIPLR